MSTAVPKWFKGLAVTGLLVTTAILSACGGEEPGSSTSGKAVQNKSATLVAHRHEAGETCFICDPTKRESGRLWCAEHSRYEDRCWICQPQLRDASRRLLRRARPV